MPIFELKKSVFGTFCGYLFAFFTIFIGYILLNIAPDYIGLKIYIAYFGGVFFVCGGFVMVFKLLNFTKIIFFDEKIEFCFKTKIISKDYNQIKNIVGFPRFYIKKNWLFYLALEMKFYMYFYLDDNKTLIIEPFLFTPSNLTKMGEILKAKKVELS